MSFDDDYEYYQQNEALANYIEDELRGRSEGLAFLYLANNGDAIEERVRICLTEAQSLRTAGFPGAALVRAAAGIEIAIRFFLARPLLQGAFLSNQWAQLLSKRLLSGRTAEDRELLPAILGNWKIDIAGIRLPSGRRLWDSVISRVWPCRNDYVHKGDSPEDEDAGLAFECLSTLLDGVVPALAERLGFTRDVTGCWCIVAVRNAPDFPNLNPPHKYERQNPFQTSVRKPIQPRLDVP